jgi:predicted dehydrogenase
MRFLVVGLGSMGKRRIRNLLALGYKELVGFDLREDRRREVAQKYNISVTDNLEAKLWDKVDAVIISTPPDRHNQYIEFCIKKRKPCFVEASVVLGDLQQLNRLAKAKRISVIPSCTLRFHPAVKTIKRLVESGQYGKISNFTHHTGQYLPDWHPWENIKDFYVGKKETGGCREIVPFELTWILDIAGFPKEAFAFYMKTSDIEVDIEDVYAIILRFGGFLGTLVVDVTSRFATKSFILNLQRAQIRWNWEERKVKVYEGETKRWVEYPDPKGSSTVGYNKNIIEKMYINEMDAFIKAIMNKDSFPNSLDDDIKILKLLEKCESTNKGVKVE